MIQHAHVHPRQGFLKALDELLVGLARLGTVAPMVVREDHRCRMEPQCLPFRLPLSERQLGSVLLSFEDSEPSGRNGR